MSRKTKSFWIVGTIAMALGMCLIPIAGCRSDGEQKAIISRFSDQLFAFIQQDAASNYADAVNSRQGDQPVNWKTGKVLPTDLTKDIPPLDDAKVAAARAALITGFQKAYAEIEQKAGPPKDLKLIEVHYLFNSDSFAQQYGILQFSLVLTLDGDKGRIYVQQDSCGLENRGVAAGGPFEVVPSIPNYYPGSSKK